MPRPHPKEFRDDVVAVARRGEAPIAQIAKDFGISESCLRNWLQRADVEDGHRPGVTSAESAELRELKRRNRLLEQENEILRRAAAYLSLSSCLCVSGSVHFQLMWLSSRSGKAMRRAPRAAFQPWVVAPSTR